MKMMNINFFINNIYKMKQPRQSRKSRVYKKKTNRPVGLAVKKYVNNALARNIENKVLSEYGANQVITTASAAPFNSVYVLPRPGLGTSKNQRIGNEIKIKKSYIRGFVNLLPYNAVTNPLSTPIYIKMWLCSYKTINTALASSTNVGTSFFEAGSSSVGPQGNMLDITLSPNEECWTVYKTKVMKLGAANATAAGQVGTGGYYDNSPMSASFYFNIGKYFKTKLRFNDATTNVPENKNCFLFIQAVNADGSISAINVAEYHYTFRHEYEDA